MMLPAGEIGALLGLFFVGLTTALPLCRRLGPLVALALAYPLGTIIWVIAAWVLLVMGLPYTPPVMLVFLACIAAAGVVWTFRQGRLQPGESSVLLMGTLVFCLLTILASGINLAVLTRDSFSMAVLAGSIAREHAIAPDSWVQFGSWGMFQVLLQSLAGFIGLEYLHASRPLLALSGLFGVFVLLVRSLTGEGMSTVRARSYAGMTVGALISSYFVTFQLFYIHNNFAVAVYLFFTVAAIWLGGGEDEPRWYVVAGIFAVAVVWQRLEAPIVLGGFVAAFLGAAEKEVRRRDALVVIVPATIVSLLWYGLLFLRAGEGGHILSPLRAVIAAAPLPIALLFSWWWHEPILERIRRRLPWLVVTALSLALLVMTVIEPVHMGTSLMMLLGHALGGMWGLLWVMAAVMAALGLALPPLRWGGLFSWGIAAHLLSVACFAFFREPYRSFWGDSGNRMLTHVVLLLFFFLTLKFGRARERSFDM